MQTSLSLTQKAQSSCLLRVGSKSSAQQWAHACHVLTKQARTHHLLCGSHTQGPFPLPWSPWSQLPCNWRQTHAPVSLKLFKLAHPHPAYPASPNLLQRPQGRAGPCPHCSLLLLLPDRPGLFPTWLPSVMACPLLLLSVSINNKFCFQWQLSPAGLTCIIIPTFFLVLFFPLSNIWKYSWITVLH